MDLYQYVRVDWDRLQEALEDVQDGMHEIPGFTRLDLLDRTLTKWIRLLGGGLEPSDEKVLFVDRQLDDLKEKLENRIVDWTSHAARTVHMLVRLIENLEITIEDEADKDAFFSKLAGFVIRFPDMGSVWDLHDLRMRHLKVNRKTWQHHKEKIASKDPGLAEELDMDIQPFLV